MPLALATLGGVKTILDFKGKDEKKKHLNNLGFVKGVRVALNKGIMSKIIVKQEN